MEDNERHTAFMSALTTEHFVLQAAAGSTISEAAARSSLYVFSLSSSLIAMGFMAQSPTNVFKPFVAAVLPAIFLLGVFTVVRLVDTTIENMLYLAGIARIRRYYRTLTPEAAAHFAASHGRWPEGTVVPSLALGPLAAHLGTTATMVAFMNSIVGGAGVCLLADELLGVDRRAIALSCGVVVAMILVATFLAYQRWRLDAVAAAVRSTATDQT
jgi:hypothetical protein